MNPVAEMPVTHQNRDVAQRKIADLNRISGDFLHHRTGSAGNHQVLIGAAAAESCTV